MTHLREEFYRLHNGEAAKLPFSDQEYEARIKSLRGIMGMMSLGTVVLLRR